MKQYISKRNRSLLGELVRTEFKLRYQGSALGYAWSLLKPLFLFAILYTVFVKFLRLGGDVPHFPVYLLLGVILWNFFNEATNQGLQSVVARGDLIRKIRIPRWIIVFSTSISAFINLLLNLVIFFIFAVINGVEFTWYLALLPFILLEIYLLALGISFLLGAMYVKFRDVNYIWEIVLQAAFYLTPVLYSLSLITDDLFKKILLMNPMAQAIQDARYVAVTTETITIHQVFSNGWYTLIPFVLTVVIFIVSILYFKSQAKSFAENI